MTRDNKRTVGRVFFAPVILFAGLAGCGETARAGNYYIDPNYAGVEGAPFGSYTAAYKTIATALGASGIPSGASPTNPNRLIFAPGVYNTAITTGVSLSNSKNNIALVGLTGNPDDVVITSFLDAAYNPGTGAIGTTGSSTLQLKGNNTSAMGITFANSTNTPYIVSTGHKAVMPNGDYVNGTTAQTANQPAVALLLQGDQQAFLNCKFLGYQDTLYTKGGRSYFKNSLVSGDIDFIFADGTTVFDNSTINLDGDHSGGTITAASTDKRTSNGIVFLNSTITANSVKNNPIIDPQGAANASGPAANNMYLGRPWGWQQVGGDASTVYINTKMPAAIRALGWLNWNSNELNAANGKQDGNPAKDSRYAEYNSMDSVGNPLDVSSRVAWSHQLTASQATAYTVANLFSFEPQYPWYGTGYPVGDANNPGTGSANPADQNYSWPAFWGDRNSNNDTLNATVSQTYPTPGNPAAYTNPNWKVASSWDPMAQLASAAIPEPSGIVLILSGSILFMLGKRRRAEDAAERT
jgi:pectinesterase